MFHVLRCKGDRHGTPFSKRLPLGDPGYRSELQKALNYSIVDLIDEFTAAGWDKWETLKALTKVVCDHALAYQEDRDQSRTSPKRKPTGSGKPPPAQATSRWRQGHGAR
ncbi:hypothetical protein ABY43_20915 [Rhizobium giardinii]